MSKKKTIEPFSRYAIIDLPIEESIRRVAKLYHDNPLAKTELIHEERLDVIYHISTPDQDAINASASIIRWQGTQTRIMVRSFRPTEHEGVDILIQLGLFWFAIIPTVLIYNRPILRNTLIVFAIHMILIAFVLYRKQYFKRHLVTGARLDKRVSAVWVKLVDVLSGDAQNNLLIEQGEQDEKQYEDYLSDVTQHQQQRF